MGQGIDAWLQTTDENQEAKNILLQKLGDDNRTHFLPPLFVDLIVKLTENTSTKVYGSPQDRAACGRVLGWLGDPRPGIRVKTEKGIAVPEFDWAVIDVDDEWPSCKIVPGDSDSKSYYRRLAPAEEGGGPLPSRYFVSKYLVTVGQFNTFEAALDNVNSDDDWFEGLSADAEQKEIWAASWPIPNHPRSDVSWYQAVAFCRWLNRVLDANEVVASEARLRKKDLAPKGWEFRLATEWEWHYAMSAQNRGTEYYPWGNAYQAGFANISTGSDRIGQSTAVGIYPQLANKGDPADGVGNLWEWCLNEYGNPKNTDKAGKESRALRGGSWYDDSEDAALGSRDYYDPYDRDYDVGFRVFCVPAIH